MARTPKCARWLPVLAAAAAAALTALAAMAEQERDEGYNQSYVFGVPAAPSEAWLLAYGGRLYDRWWVPLEREPPERPHPAKPASPVRTYEAAAESWRCVACHGWDYRGRAGIKGIEAMAGADPDRIAAIVRGPLHRYARDMISDTALRALALFVARGQYDMRALVDYRTHRITGDVGRGRALYQNACAICHDYDGRAWIFGESEGEDTLAAVALRDPWQVLHKTLNGVPNADMPAMRAFDLQIVLDVLAYGQTLPTR